ncbi:MAG: hypothetical protein H7Y19_01140 [Luteimonas sp.]|nr:hypothetical protein [Luteimonas sp.]
MSSTPNATPAAKPSAAGRYLFLFLLGLVLGVVATVMAMRALDARKDHFPDSVMQVQQWHLNQLKDNVDRNRCAATDTLPHLQTLRTMANDIEPAMGDLRDDERFAKHASQLRATLDGALSAPPLNCAGVGSVLGKVGEDCKACHQDFRN